MITFDPPLSVNRPSITQKNGTVHNFNPIVVNELDFTLMDNAKHKYVCAQLFVMAKPLFLWRDEAYDAAGDYTQAQAEARILELLGSNPAEIIADLFFR